MQLNTNSTHPTHIHMNVQLTSARLSGLGGPIGSEADVCTFARKRAPAWVCAVRGDCRRQPRETLAETVQTRTQTATTDGAEGGMEVMSKWFGVWRGTRW